MLWSCVAAIQDEHPEHVIYIITKHSKTTDSNIVDAAKVIVMHIKWIAELDCV